MNLNKPQSSSSSFSNPFTTSTSRCKKPRNCTSGAPLVATSCAAFQITKLQIGMSGNESPLGIWIDGKLKAHGKPPGFFLAHYLSLSHYLCHPLVRKWMSPMPGWVSARSGLCYLTSFQVALAVTWIQAAQFFQKVWGFPNLPTNDMTEYPGLSPRLALPTGFPKRAEEDMAL